MSRAERVLVELGRLRISGGSARALRTLRPAGGRAGGRPKPLDPKLTTQGRDPQPPAHTVTGQSLARTEPSHFRRFPESRGRAGSPYFCRAPSAVRPTE